MTDEQIIKAWEDKKALIEIGESAPLSIEFITNTLDIINRQNRKIENLKESLYHRHILLEDSFKKRDELSEEIKRLQKENHRFADIGKMYSEIRIEVIKEFAERLKEKAKFCRANNGCQGGAVWVDDINNLVNEMEAENNV